MSKLKVFKDFSDVPSGATNMSSLKGRIVATYSQLVDALGEPTNNSPSSDDKVQVEWVVKYKGDFYTIYDWKTYDRNYTETKLDVFNVGGKTPAYDVIDYIEKLLS